MNGEPLLEACLIVRDEESSLPPCLASLAGLVDGVVVYDTGSTDGTREAALAAAALVSLPLDFVEGYWDDDFGRARNSAIEHCRATWVFVIDADERAVADDADEVRSLLRRSTTAPGSGSDVDAFQVSVDNAGPTELSPVATHISLRILRRERCLYAGRLHERPVIAGGRGDPRASYLPSVRIAHRGYVSAGVDSAGKSGRNLRISNLDPGGDAELAAVYRGLSLLSSGSTGEAAEQLEQALAASGLPGPVRRRVLFHLVDAYVELGRLRDATRTVEATYRACDDTALPFFSEAKLRYARAASTSDDAMARPELERLAELVASMGPRDRDEDGRELGSELLSERMVRGLLALDRPVEAAWFALDMVAQRDIVPGGLDLVLESLDQADLPTALFADALAPHMASRVARAASELSAPEAARLVGALAVRWPEGNTPGES